MGYRFEVFDQYIYSEYLDKVMNYDGLVGWVYAFIEHEAFQPGTNVLWDACKIEIVELDFSDMQRFGDFLLTKRERRGGGLSAFVTHNDLVFGMFRTHEMLNQEKFDYNYHVFRALDEAQQWILDEQT